jgi:tetratricopeptide (TPR) repeat protein
LIEKNLNNKREQFPIQSEEPDAARPFQVQVPEPIPTRLAYSLEEKEKALKEFDSDLPPLPNDERILKNLMSKALLLLDNGDVNNAKKILASVLTRDSQNSPAIKWLGYCFQAEEKFDEAKKCYETLAKIDPNIENIFLLGQAYYDCGDLDDAKAAFEKVLSKTHYESPFLFDIYKNIGNILLKKGDLDGAEENYNRAHTLSPHSDVLSVNYGTLELQRGKLDQASKRFLSALRLNERNDKAWVGLSLIHKQKMDGELGWAAIQRALDLNLKNKTALRIIIEWGLQELKYDGPIERLQNYLEIISDDVEMSFSLAYLLNLSGLRSEALVELERVLTLNPFHKEAPLLKEEISKYFENVKD